MDDFNTIRLKKKTLVKFKNYSKKISPSYSETLDFMIAFFEDNNLSPYDTLGMNLTSYSNIIGKRMDAVVSILRNVEETQLKPTKKMLESLFKGVEKRQPKYVEKIKFKEPVLTTENKELTYYRDAYFKQQTEFDELKYKLKDTLKDFKLVKNTFSSRHYVLKVSEEDYQELKNSIKIT
ncbi:BfmA/BtgA family mobilization protein [Changchengzhania lutea]|uniref:BfmA/BtgA family mobilization protein n=1 Tax=Changchengzhania lutea TaxID=2049305 RepID=UPI00115DBFF8|nr:BfmA/BtgA family mobilization protein [Changchengzhania lutea]